VPLQTSNEGRFAIRTVLPANYRVDPNGSWVRVKHLHFKLFADGEQPLTTQIFLLPDDYTDTDLLYKPELATELRKLQSQDMRPEFQARFDFVLKRVSMTGYILAAASRRASI